MIIEKSLQRSKAQKNTSLLRTSILANAGGLQWNGKIPGWRATNRILVQGIPYGRSVDAFSANV